ncbi:hypothetical protein HDU93_008002 [Gonapodya sp. JEL0774]|nr:hypothetical protein HDU93_008002 [Gonapodya sp. JEL0774]
MASEYGFDAILDVDGRTVAFKCRLCNAVLTSPIDVDADDSGAARKAESQEQHGGTEFRELAEGAGIEWLGRVFAELAKLCCEAADLSGIQKALLDGAKPNVARKTITLTVPKHSSTSSGKKSGLGMGMGMLGMGIGMGGDEERREIVQMGEPVIVLATLTMRADIVQCLCEAGADPNLPLSWSTPSYDPHTSQWTFVRHTLPSALDLALSTQGTFNKRGATVRFDLPAPSASAAAAADMIDELTLNPALEIVQALLEGGVQVRRRHVLRAEEIRRGVLVGGSVFQADDFAELLEGRWNGDEDGEDEDEEGVGAVDPNLANTDQQTSSSPKLNIQGLLYRPPSLPPRPNADPLAGTVVDSTHAASKEEEWGASVPGRRSSARMSLELQLQELELETGPDVEPEGDLDPDSKPEEPVFPHPHPPPLLAQGNKKSFQRIDSLAIAAEILQGPPPSWELPDRDQNSRQEHEGVDTEHIPANETVASVIIPPDSFVVTTPVDSSPPAANSEDPLSSVGTPVSSTPLHPPPSSPLSDLAALGVSLARLASLERERESWLEDRAHLVAALEAERQRTVHPGPRVESDAAFQAKLSRLAWLEGERERWEREKAEMTANVMEMRERAEQVGRTVNPMVAEVEDTGPVIGARSDVVVSEASGVTHGEPEGLKDEEADSVTMGMRTGGAIDSDEGLLMDRESFDQAPSAQQGSKLALENPQTRDVEAKHGVAEHDHSSDNVSNAEAMSRDREPDRKRQPKKRSADGSTAVESGKKRIAELERAINQERRRANSLQLTVRKLESELVAERGRSEDLRREVERVVWEMQEERNRADAVEAELAKMEEVAAGERKRASRMERANMDTQGELDELKQTTANLQHMYIEEKRLREESQRRVESLTMDPALLLDRSDNGYTLQPDNGWEDALDRSTARLLGPSPLPPSRPPSVAGVNGTAGHLVRGDILRWPVKGGIHRHETAPASFASPHSPKPGVCTEVTYQVRLNPPHYARTQLRCVAAFQPRTEDEIALQVGDVVLCIWTFDDGWGGGTNRSTAQSGYFPLSHLRSAGQNGGIDGSSVTTRIDWSVGMAVDVPVPERLHSKRRK